MSRSKSLTRYRPVTRHGGAAVAFVPDPLGIWVRLADVERLIEPDAGSDDALATELRAEANAVDEMDAPGALDQAAIAGMCAGLRIAANRIENRRAEYDELRAENERLTRELDALRTLARQEAASQASAAVAARQHSDPDAPERARTHEFAAALLESLLDVAGR